MSEERINLRLNAELRGRLDREADKQGVSMNRLITNYIKVGTDTFNYHKLMELGEHGRYLTSLSIFMSSILTLVHGEEICETAREETVCELKRLGLYPIKLPLNDVGDDKNA